MVKRQKFSFKVKYVDLDFTPFYLLALCTLFSHKRCDDVSDTDCNVASWMVIPETFHLGWKYMIRVRIKKSIRIIIQLAILQIILRTS